MEGKARGSGATRERGVRGRTGGARGLSKCCVEKLVLRFLQPASMEDLDHGLERDSRGGGRMRWQGERDREAGGTDGYRGRGGEAGRDLAGKTNGRRVEEGHVFFYIVDDKAVEDGFVGVEKRHQELLAHIQTVGGKRCWETRMQVRREKKGLSRGSDKNRRIKV